MFFPCHRAWPQSLVSRCAFVDNPRCPLTKFVILTNCCGIQFRLIHKSRHNFWKSWQACQSQRFSPECDLEFNLRTACMGSTPLRDSVLTLLSNKWKHEKNDSPLFARMPKLSSTSEEFWRQLFAWPPDFCFTKCCPNLASWVCLTANHVKWKRNEGYMLLFKIDLFVRSKDTFVKKLMIMLQLHQALPRFCLKRWSMQNASMDRAGEW